MRPKGLRLAGFAGIQSGQGKREITIDFTTVADGLIAIAGPNGSGKTTIMDNMHPYRVMPSKSNGYTPGTFSFYEEMSASEAEKELTWSHGGAEYRSLVKIRWAGKSKKQEAYLFVQENQEWKPYETARGVKSDGKTESYDICVETILGRPEVFFNSQFSCQSKTPISSMGVSDVKALMTAMLGADKIKELSVQAGDVARLLKPQLLDLKTTGEPLLATIARERALLESKSQIATFIDSVIDGIRSGEAQVEAAIADLSTKESAALAQEATKAQLDVLNDQERMTVQANKERLQQFDSQANADAQAAERNVFAANSALTQAKATQQGVHQRMAQINELVMQEAEAQEAEKRVGALRSKISDLRMKADDLQFDAKPIQALRVQLDQITEICTSGRAEGVALAKLIEMNQTTASLLNDVPCAGTGLQGKCNLIANANKAATDLQAQEVKIASLRTSLTTNVESRKTAKSKLDEMLQAEQRFKSVQSELLETQTLLEQAKTASGLLAQIQAAKAQVPVVKAELEAAARNIASAQAHFVEVQAVRTGMNAQNATRRAELQSNMDQELVRIAQVRATLPKLIETTELDSLRRQVAAKKSRLAEQRGQLEEARGKQRDIGYGLEQVQEAKKDLAALDGRSAQISIEISQWVLLQKALGNDGIIALSIDDAGPTIARHCNDLLEECFGGRFAVRLETQKSNDAGVARETFEILVTDTLRAETKSVEKLSGGEMVWVNECLIRAMALYVGESTQDRSANETLFTDEADGPLDPERKRQFMAMKRAVLRLGGYQREYLITHTPELRAACDAVVDITAI